MTGKGFALAALAVFVLAHGVVAQDSAARLTEAAFTEWADDNDVQSASLVLVRHNEIALKVDRGDYTTSTSVPVASQSKLITGLCIVRLVESDRLGFDTGLDEALPDFFSRHAPSDARAKSITIADLVTHTSGITYDPSQGVSLKAFEPYSQSSAKAQLAAALSAPLGGTPGESFAYNNMNYVALELAIQAASGLSYESYCKQAVLEPVGISGASLNPRWRVMGGYGGWRISAEDYARLMRYLAPGSTLLKTAPGDWPRVSLGGGASYSIGTLMRESGSWYNFWHFGSWVAGNGPMDNFGAYFAHWEGNTAVIANYTPTVSESGMGALDSAMSSAALN
jgi:CubicO group peptidase (beta-lactamase class C family)